ncbi:MAG: hypothetical protein WC123_07640 [Bacilli bacterium]
MIRKEFALLETGCHTVEEFIAAFWDKKSVNYSTSNIRKEYCDKCNSLKCDRCFIHDSLQEIHKLILLHNRNRNITISHTEES